MPLRESFGTRCPGTPWGDVRLISRQNQGALEESELSSAQTGEIWQFRECLSGAGEGSGPFEILLGKKNVFSVVATDAVERVFNNPLSLSLSKAERRGSTSSPRAAKHIVKQSHGRRVSLGAMGVPLYGDFGHAGGDKANEASRYLRRDDSITGEVVGGRPSGYSFREGQGRLQAAITCRLPWRVATLSGLPSAQGRVPRLPWSGKYLQ